MIMEYVWLVPLVPLLCFVISGFFGNKTPQGGGYIAISGALIAFIISVLVSYEYLTGDLYANNLPYVQDVQWLVIGGYEINFGVYIDSLACVMMLFSSLISMLIFVYSLGYMNDQGVKKRRYFAEVSLFLTGMLGLVISSNYLEMFVFWEIMGLCSYLLIGFWSFQHPDGDDASVNASSAAKKAFLVTRMGDVCLMSGLFILLYLFQSLDYTVVFDASTIATVQAENSGLLTAAVLLIFGGVIGKSAQFPLHDWLPDAMAGPTTVSALIHAATMVKAGVYLTARSYPIFIQSADVMLLVAIIGGVTAIFAASMALNNMNIKRVLAYSTISQLGYMILALGAGGYLMAIGIETGNGELITLGVMGYIAGIFHMINHAFFKGLLFLGSGSVIHSCGTEDMRLMGGLHKKMKITSITMLLGSLSIAGFPLFSGFWSKDMVLEAAFGPYANGLGAGSWFCLLFILGIITAFMTAFYMFRMWFMTFAGEEHESSKHAHGESSKSMTAPLCVLSVFAVFSGFLILFGLGDVISETLKVTYESLFMSLHVEVHSGTEIAKEIFTNVWTYIAIALALIGIGIAYLMYAKKSINPGKFNKNGEGMLYKVLAKRYYFPQLYNQIAWKAGYEVARGVDFIDRNVIDGTVNGLSNAVVGSADVVSKAQTGYVRNYAGFVVVGVMVLSAVLAALFYVMGGI
ncbi:MAG: proton-conducting transporter membrane subunit [Candidatus Methanomethylophilaceae archaeon]